MAADGINDETADVRCAASVRHVDVNPVDSNAHRHLAPGGLPVQQDQIGAPDRKHRDIAAAGIDGEKEPGSKCERPL